MITLQLKKNRKIYFAGDFHLGRPNKESSSEREKKIIRWLNEIKSDAQEVFLMGDLFDFWFEYHNVIPKNNLRFLASISNMIDEGINFHYFVGNHDLWVINYFEELGIKVYSNTQSFKINSKTLLAGHGDGIGKGDTGYKILKSIFKNKICQFLFRWIHPDIGIPLGEFLSGSKTKMNITSKAKVNDKRIFQYCVNYNHKSPTDIFIFGHSHYVNKEKISDNSIYFNCGEWINNSFFLESDGEKYELKEFN
tara:strand:- start:464 stop:1216 length:753 start_codon:yes stop_codon:yes gene_type:complete